MKKPVILVLGGISESLKLAAGLSEKGCHVLVSRATNVYQDEPQLPGVHFRHGVLDQPGLEKLAARKNISAIIDCTHPFAEQISQNAFNAAMSLGLPFLAYERPGLDPDTPGVLWAKDHFQAADMALAGERTVLLSIGSGNIQTYAGKAGKNILLLFARVLPGPLFLRKCLDAGLKKKQVIQARGPFNVEENTRHIRRTQAGVLVTKDSGEAGGVPAKLEAAARLGVKVVMVKRPPGPGGARYGSIRDIVDLAGSGFQGLFA